ncbi:MAG TPA: hypothetical protein VGB23_04120 [Nitrospirota bacterium]
MKTCNNCTGRKMCVKTCAEIEAGLPKEYTGRDSRREVGMSEAGMEAALDGHAFSAWSHAELVSSQPGPDLSALTLKERKAVMLVASGMSQRGAARYLKISLNALQSRINSARARLQAGHDARLVKAENAPYGTKKGGAR